MKKTILWMLLGVWLGAMGLAGCGQTGPLYLPKSTNQASSSSTQKAAKPQVSQVQPIAQPTQSIAGPASSTTMATKPLAPPTQPLVQPTKPKAVPAQQQAKP
ncbi:MAG TPA: lipoprotein [Cellvibrio sp.]|nr:lipoprotein [Cellvibrio sp.]